MCLAEWCLKHWSWKSLNLTKVVVYFSQSVEWTKKACCQKLLVKLGFSCMLLISNHVLEYISTRKFFQRPQSALTLRAPETFIGLRKIHSCLFIPNCTRNHVITYTTTTTTSSYYYYFICAWPNWKHSKYIFPLIAFLLLCKNPHNFLHCPGFANMPNLAYFTPKLFRWLHRGYGGSRFDSGNFR